MMVQGAAIVWLGLAARILEDAGFSSLLRTTTMFGLFAATGAGAFWWANPLKGAACGLVTLAGLLASNYLHTR